MSRFATSAGRLSCEHACPVAATKRHHRVRACFYPRYAWSGSSRSRDSPHDQGDASTGSTTGVGGWCSWPAAALYIVSPIDAVPEAIFLVVGLIDDAFVATWLTGALLSETERFLEWETAAGPRALRWTRHRALTGRPYAPPVAGARVIGCGHALCRQRRRADRQHSAGPPAVGDRGHHRPRCWPRWSTSTPAAASRTASRVRMVEDGREGRAAPARRHDRRADEWQHRRRSGPGGPAEGLPLRLRLPGQGQRGQAQRAAGATAPRWWSARPRRAGGPALVLPGLRPAGPGDRRRLEARPVRQPEQPAVALRDRPVRSCGSRPRGGSRTSSPASVPAARSPAPAGTSRRPPAVGSA